jgi:hypothetical protein
VSTSAFKRIRHCCGSKSEFLKTKTKKKKPKLLFENSNCSVTSDSSWAGNILDFVSVIFLLCRSQRPLGPRRGSAAVHLLGLWVRISSRTWVSVSFECCVLSGRVLYRADHSSRGVLPRSSIMRRPWGCCVMVKKLSSIVYFLLYFT